MSAGPLQVGLFAPKSSASGGIRCDGWQVSESAIWRQGDVAAPEDNLSRVAAENRQMCARKMIEYALDDGPIAWIPARLEGGRVAWDGGSAAVDACYLPALEGRLEVEALDQVGQWWARGGSGVAVLSPVGCSRIRAWQGNTLMAVVMPCRE